MPDLEQGFKDQAEVAALVEKAKKQISAPMRTALRNFTQDAITKWVMAFGDRDAKADSIGQLQLLKVALKNHILLAPTAVGGGVAEAVANGHQLGATQANRLLPSPVQTPPFTPGEKLTAEIANVQAKAEKRLANAGHFIDNLSEGDSFDDLDGAMASFSQAVSGIEMDTTWLVNTAAALGSRDTAEAAGVGTVFVGEREACLDCNPYIGLTDKQRNDDPPIHPNCQCSLQPWSDEWAGNTTSYPDALRREADRAVLRGSSDYDSNAARVRAAQALLSHGTDLPASVKQVARKAVRKGQF